MARYINAKEIQSFVDAVEKKKNYRRNYNLILRHLLEEMGELSRAIWLLESNYAISYTGDDGQINNEQRVGGELVDIISLCVYIATVLEVDINAAFQWRFERVARQYGVDFKKNEDN